MRGARAVGDDRPVNPTVARALIALTYPLRLHAHLTDPRPARR
jgi:hypothetical protein